MGLKDLLRKWSIEKLSQRVVRSLTDNDLYKFTMQYAILTMFPNAIAKYRFINRRPEGKFTPEFLQTFRECIAAMADLRLTDSAREHLARTCPFLPPHYLAYLAKYRFNPEQIVCNVTPIHPRQNGELLLQIHGPWHETVLWEVPLMAIISELFYILIDTDWDDSVDDQVARAQSKRDSLQKAGCLYSEFGTRRRRSYEAQQIVVRELRSSPNFVGTSNVYLSEQLNLVPKGTLAHEMVQGVSALMGLRHANRFTLDVWNSVYQGNLGIALPDTFGRKAFFDDFSLHHAKLWDGVRQDSGNPFEFTDDTIAHYKKLGIDPSTKVILYSNDLRCPYEFKGSLSVPCNKEGVIDGHNDATVIQRQTQGRVIPRFGIGTFLSNDFRVRSRPHETSSALNMVIKLCEMDGVPVVKLSDDPGKAMGDPSALADAAWTFNNIPITLALVKQ